MIQRGRKWLALAAGTSFVGLVIVGGGVASAQDTSNGQAGMEEVKFELPKAVFAGTPKNVPPGTTVQKPTGKPRAPLIAPVGTKNVALNKKVTSSDSEPIVGSLDMVTDGQKEGTEGSWVELGPNIQWVQVDLEKPTTVYGVLVWHQHADPRVYRDVIVQVSDDPEFKKDVKTIFNNDQDNTSEMGAGKDYEYFEAAEGKLMDAKSTDPKGVTGRYVRCYSKGSTADDQNHYTEVEVYGIPK